MKIYKCSKCNYERIDRVEFERNKPALSQGIEMIYRFIKDKCPRCESIDKNGVEHDLSINMLL